VNWRQLGVALPAVSVVMTTFDCVRFVREAIASILAQTFTDFEFVIVDDGSTDGTVEAIREFRDPRIHLAQVSRRGRIASLNHAFRLARAPLVANHDADDVALPERLELSVKAMREHPEWAMLGAAEVPLIDEGGQQLGTRTRQTEPRKLRRDLGHSMPFFHSTCMYRKAAWEAAGGFDESLAMFEDYDLWVRLAASHDVANLPVPLAKKRRHAAQAFDHKHWTNLGYRTRSRILWRYVRRVRPDPAVVARAGVYMLMTPRLRLLWIKALRRDKLELQVREHVRPHAPSTRPAI